VKLQEIYEGMRSISVRSIATRILELKHRVQFGGRLTDAEWQWLRLSSENQSLLRSLRKGMKKYINHNKYYDDDSEYLSTASLYAEAQMYLLRIKQQLDDDARTAVLHATDEAMNTEELRQLAQAKAYNELQTTYAENQADSIQRVGELAQSACNL
jgi:hypothetical protein